MLKYKIVLANLLLLSFLYPKLQSDWIPREKSDCSAVELFEYLQDLGKKGIDKLLENNIHKVWGIFYSFPVGSKRLFQFFPSKKGEELKSSPR